MCFGDSIEKIAISFAGTVDEVRSVSLN